jgi:hypothetical protein
MRPVEARQIIEVLAKGIDPATGEVLPEDSPVHNPHVIRALFLAAQALASTAELAERVRKPLPASAGKGWSEDEDRRLAEAFDAGTSVADLAALHERSRGAITSRLIRLGRLQPRS